MRTSPRVRQLGRYEVVLELSRGGMGELYLARRLGAGGFEKLVAIKRILPHLASEPAFVELFQHEAKIAAKLSHPNVCTVFELDEADGELFLVMEYLDGVAWDALAHATPASEILPLATSVLAQACEGLHHAHAVPVIHRDVSPQNLFVTTAGVCKVLDFGVAKLANEGPRTRTGMLKGKLPYMAPEQIEGGEVDPRADVWSLGVVLWEALARRSLFDRDTDFQIWKAVTEETVPVLADQPAAINAVIGRATARKREDRYPTAREMGEALRAAAPPLDPRTIAELLARHCGDRLVERAAAVAAATEDPHPIDPSASATLVDAAATAQLRSKPVVIERPRSAAATAAMPESRHRSRWPIAIGLIGVAAIVGVVIIATRKPEPAPAPPSPPEQTAPVTEVASAPAPVPAAEPVKDVPVKPAPRKTPSPPVRVAPVEHGTLTVDSNPFASVVVDGKVIGDTPMFHAKLTAGAHHLRLVRDDGRAQDRDITIPADHDLNLGRIAW